MGTPNVRDDIARKLGDLEAQLQAETLARPSTLEKSRQQEHRRPLVEQVRQHAAELRARLDAIDPQASPLLESVSKDLERRWARITDVLAQATHHE